MPSRKVRRSRPFVAASLLIQRVVHPLPPIPFSFASPLLVWLAICWLAGLGSAQAQTATLAWDPNPEPNIARYTLRYGTASGVYDQQADAGFQTEVTLSGLQYDTTYYCVVTASNTAGFESPPSAEISFQLQRPPNVVVNLPPGSVYNQTNPIALSADFAGSISRIEFFAGSELIGSTTPANPILQWRPPEGGVRTITAVAYQGTNQVISSSPVEIRIVIPAITGLRFLPDRSLQFTVTGAPGKNQHIYASDNLHDWNLLTTRLNTTGAMEIVDESARGATQRFYQVLSD